METRVEDLFCRTIAETVIQDFEESLRGPLLRAGTPGYEDARRIWNAHTRSVPSPYSQIAVEYHHGPHSRVKLDETAYPHRATGWNLAIGGSWLNESESERNISWVRTFWKDMEPLMSGGVYVNFMSAGEDDRIKVAYGENYDRLVSVKNRYDPTNLFRVNENIKPNVSSTQ